MRWTPVLVCSFLAFGPALRGAQSEPPVITVGGQSFATWQDYVNSDLFRSQGLRCGSRTLGTGTEVLPGSDCALDSSSIRGRYAPEGHARFRIPVVVHVLQSTAGEGQISDAQVQSQIDVLNEDLGAIQGTPGENGTDARIEFFLATVDPFGNPTSGITRSIDDVWFDDVWFDDGGDYFDVLAWDTGRYLNIYTNRASGTLGYVPDLPQGGIVGTPADRVVILWAAFGRNAPIGPPFDLGRTATHEVGHYLGLYHTFDFGCGTPAECYTSGDRICDTEPEAVAVHGCPSSSSSCDTPDPFHNYMDYSDDACYQEFTPEQVNRMRCTLEGWRPMLPDCTVLAAVNVRNAGANLDTYSATSPVLGGSSVVNVVAPAFTSAVLLGYGAPANVPLPRGNVLLIDSTSAFFFRKVVALPTSGVSLPIPNLAALCGQTLFTQAILIGGAPFALTNAVDMTIGE